MTDTEVALVRRAVQEHGEPWPKWPGGWPDEIELALLDSIFSIRARYGRPSRGGNVATGVHAVIDRWRAHVGALADDLPRLADFHDQPDALAEILGNRQTLRAGSKAATAATCAKHLVDAHVRHAGDVTGSDDQRQAWTGTKGLGEVTWSYFLMLLGKPGVKADVMVRRFVSTAVGRRVGPDEARDLVVAVADDLRRSPTDLDHAIWQWQRSRG